MKRILEMGEKSEKLSKTIKLSVPAGVFLIFGGGRWINLALVSSNDYISAAGWAVLYGLTLAFMFFFAADLVLARGMLLNRINAIRVLVLFIVVITIANSLVKEFICEYAVYIFLPEIFLLILIFILFGILSGRENIDYQLDMENILPETYRKKHPVKTFLELLFRLFPYPVPVGLYRAGNPSEKSPVIVTGNYELTVRRVVRQINETDCWLLVCDSRGINIWCSTLAAHFGTEKIIKAIEHTRLAQKTKNRNLLLPQLCAAGVDINRIRKATGFSCCFGPVKISDLKIYSADHDNREIRKVTFTAKERLEMAFGTLIIPVIILSLIFNFINPGMLFIIIPSVYGLSFLNAYLYPFRIFKNIRLWSMFLAALVFVFFILLMLITEQNFWIYNITLTLSVIYLVNEFEGWSPMVKFSMTSAYKHASIVIDGEKCTGCGTCIEVCPKAVYKIGNKKSEVSKSDECISCKSCFIQCPAGAINHSAESIDESL